MRSPERARATGRKPRGCSARPSASSNFIARAEVRHRLAPLQELDAAPSAARQVYMPRSFVTVATRLMATMWRRACRIDAVLERRLQHRVGTPRILFSRALVHFSVQK